MMMLRIGILTCSWACIVPFAALFVTSGAVAAPAVSNVSASQRTDGSGMVDIYYDLSNGEGEITVSVVFSSDGGATWAVTPQAQYLSGDVGVVTNGTGKHIVWDMLADQPEVCWPDMGMRLIVEDEAPEMVSIPAGTFSMGDPWGEGDADEVPVHEVTLSVYEIGKYEVKNQEYADILNWANGQGYLTTASTTTADAYGVQLLDVDSSYCQITWSGSAFVVDTRDTYSMADHPVVEVTWYGAAVYCNWLSESQGLTPCYNTSTWECTFSNNGYHLPTEAQWERAAAWDGSKHYRYGNGNDSISSSDVNYNSNNPLGLSGYPYTSPVGYYAGVTSPVGCYDMSGNVWEWCNDWYDSGYYSSSPASNPEGPSSGSYRLVRGGSWYSLDLSCRSAYRNHFTPDDSYFNLGFRVARTP